MHMLKLTQIGNSVGVILPKEASGAPEARKGRIGVSNRNAGRLCPHAHNPALEEEINAGREFMREFRDTFHQLAK